MSASPADLKPETIHETIRSLIANLVTLSDPTGEFARPTSSGQIVDSKSWSGWDWAHGIGLLGIWNYYELTHDPHLLQIIEDWFESHLHGTGTSKNINKMAVFLTLAHLYNLSQNPTYLPWLDSWAEWVMHDLPRTTEGGMQHITSHDQNPQQLWDDTLMMAVLPLAKIGVLLDRPQYIAEAIKQFDIHVKYLFDEQTGLFFHGWTFEDGGHNFARARWARGNSWLTMAIPELIELLGLPPSDSTKISLTSTLRTQCFALTRLQDHDSGLWHTLLDHFDLGSYLESSATAGFAYGMLKACRLGHIEADEFRESAEKAIKGILANVSCNGELLNTSFGTAMGRDLDFYRVIPKTAMPYGQAMAVMALTEYLRNVSYGPVT